MIYMLLFLIFTFGLNIKKYPLALDCTSYIIKQSLQSSILTELKKNNLIFENNQFKATKKLNENTLYYPFSLIENPGKFKNFLFDKKEKTYKFRNMETDLGICDIINVYMKCILDKSHNREVIVAYNDYYDEDMKKELAKAFDTDKINNIHMVPLTSSVVINSSLSFNKNYTDLVISSRGTRTVYSYYEILYKDNKVTNINLIFREECSVISDTLLDDIIMKHVKKTLYDVCKDTKEKIYLLPLENEIEIEEDDFYVIDILDVCDAIKKILHMDNIDHYSHLESMAYNNKDHTRRRTFDGITYNLDNIRNEILEYLKENEAQITEVKEKVNEKIMEYQKNNKSDEEVTMNKTLISDHYLFFTKYNVFGKDLANIQEQFVIDGLIKYLNCKITFSENLITRGLTSNTNQSSKLMEEIKLKNLLKAKINKIKKENEISKSFPNIFEYKLTDLIEKVNNLKTSLEAFGVLEDVENVDLMKVVDVKNILKELTTLERRNALVVENANNRERALKFLEKVLEDVKKMEETENEVWESGLYKKYDKTKKWYDENKSNMSVLGDVIEEKAGLLEGFIKVFRDRLANIKEQEKKKEQTNGTTNTLEQLQKELADGKLPNFKDMDPKQLEEFQKQFAKYSEIFKDGKFPNKKDSENGKEENILDENNQDNEEGEEEEKGNDGKEGNEKIDEDKKKPDANKVNPVNGEGPIQEDDSSSEGRDL